MFIINLFEIARVTQWWPQQPQRSGSDVRDNTDSRLHDGWSCVPVSSDGVSEATVLPMLTIHINLEWLTGGVLIRRKRVAWHRAGRSIWHIYDIHIIHDTALYDMIPGYMQLPSLHHTLGNTCIASWVYMHYTWSAGKDVGHTASSRHV